MTNYQVTLTKPVRVHGKRRIIGDVVEVDELTFAELKYHNAFEDAVEIDGGNDGKGDNNVQNNSQDDNNVQGDSQDQTNVTLLEELPGYKSITTDGIKAQLTLREIDFDSNDKSELYKLLKTAMGITDESGE